MITIKWETMGAEREGEEDIALESGPHQRTHFRFKVSVSCQQQANGSTATSVLRPQHAIGAAKKCCSASSSAHLMAMRRYCAVPVLYSTTRVQYSTDYRYHSTYIYMLRIYTNDTNRAEPRPAWSPPSPITNLQQGAKTNTKEMKQFVSVGCK